MAGFDPLASSPISIDKALRPKPSDRNDLIAIRIAQLVAAGFTEEEATKIAADTLRLHGQGAFAGAAIDASDPANAQALAGRVANLRKREARQDAFAQQMADIYTDPKGDVSDVDAILGRTMTPAGYVKTGTFGPVNEPDEPLLGRRVPAPRGFSGDDVQRGAGFEDDKTRDAYYKRPTMPDGTTIPSQEDIDMRARGFAPVHTTDGVRYMVAGGADGVGMPGRLGKRRDLEDAGWAASKVLGPTGEQMVYRPGADARARYDAQAQARAIDRIARSAGINGDDALAAMTAGGIDNLRAVAKLRKLDDAAERRANWKAQMMLAGADPSKNIVNALGMLSGEDRANSLRYMLPGGQLAAQVDAVNAQRAGQMAQQAMTAFLANNPVSTEAQRAMLAQQLRQSDPSGAGATDIAGGKRSTPPAIAELERLAKSFDTTYGGFSVENERRFAEALMGPPYNLDQGEAEALAYEYADKRRRIWSQGGGPAGGQAAPRDSSTVQAAF